MNTTLRRAARIGAILLCVAGLVGAGGMQELTGTASYYGAGEPLNENTSMNIPFDPRLMECASWEFPLGSVLEVTSLRTGRKVIVRCTDRGPNKRLNRLIDLTREAFAEIDNLKSGLTQVHVRRVK